MNPWNLLWIIPLSVVIGAVVMALAVAAGRDRRDDL